MEKYRFVPFLTMLLVLSITLLVDTYSNAPPLNAATNIYSARSGNWSDPDLWADQNGNPLGRTPAQGDNVTIHNGHTVTYNLQSNAVLGSLTLDHATLSFSRQTSASLRLASNLIVGAGGFLDLGTAANPIPPQAQAQLTFVFPAGKTFSGGSQFVAGDTGLWVEAGGRWESHGALLRRTWSDLAQDAQAGATSLVVTNDVTDWYRGGTVVITSSAMPREYYLRNDGKEMSNGIWQEELRQITNLESLPNGQTRITLDKPLAYQHLGAAPFQAEVGLLTRNVKISTALEGYNTPDDALWPDLTQRRFAHTQFMYGSTGNVQYTELKYMGQVNKTARYPIHIHMMEDTSRGMVIRGNAIWMSGFRWVTLHDSNGVLVEDNVGYDAVSSGFFLEKTLHKYPTKEGPHQNAFIHNLGVRTRRIPDNVAGGAIDGQASVFWIDHLDQSLMGNVATGAFTISDYDASGDHFGAIQTAEGANNSGRLYQPFLMLHNESHSNFSTGIKFWNNEIPVTDVLDFDAWRNGYGGIFWGAYNAPYRFFNARLIENGRVGIEARSIRAYLQDSVISGGSGSNASRDQGIVITNYVSAASPAASARLIRSVLKNHRSGDLIQSHTPCNTAGDDALPIVAETCSAVYLESLGSQFLSGAPLDFGWQANKNSYWKFFDYGGSGGYPADFVLLRKDQANPASQGAIPAKLVNGQAVYNAGADALLIPMDSLSGAVIELGASLLDPLNRWDVDPFTFATRADYPPQAALTVNVDGNQAVMQATASDDHQISKVEFWMDEQLIATRAALPYQQTVDLSGRERRYSYLYAKAYDDQGQVAYSRVVEVGPVPSGDDNPAMLPPIVEEPVNEPVVEEPVDPPAADEQQPTSRITLPGRIEAEDYREGGEGVGYHDTTTGNSGKAYRTDNVDIEPTTDANGGYNVGWIVPGEWLAYDVTVAQSGLYDLTARVATVASGPKTLHVAVDGVDLTGPMTFYDASGWQSWGNVTASGVELTAGNHEVRIALDDQTFNLNYLDVTLPDQTCDGAPATIVGTNGDDTLIGTDGRDVIAGLDGNDLIQGLDGDDIICGGGGHDTIYAGNGADRLFGQWGRDTLNGGSGNDYLDGGSSPDTLNGDQGDDRLYGGGGNDTLNSGDGNDYLNGGGGDDALNGGEGNDLLRGGEADDTLEGGRDTDTLDGGDGVDRCSSGEVLSYCEL